MTDPEMLTERPACIVRFLGLALAVAILVAGLPPTRAGADGRLDFPLPNGHFFGQATGGSGGFSIVDDREARFWSAFQTLGGVQAVGYPLSQRFVWDGFVSQVMQKGVFQWRPESGTVVFVNVLDRMSAAGLDEWLRTRWLTPYPEDTAADTGRPWPAVVERHLAMLDGNPAIRARFLATPRWLELYGLPMATADDGDVYVVRAQRAIFQQWRIATPWSRPGDVLLANTGEVLRASGLLAPGIFAPEPWPAAAREPVRLRIPAIGVDAPVATYGTLPDGTLPAPEGPHLVAWYSYSALPGTAGNTVVSGHLDWRGGSLGVFWRLKDVAPGDVIALDTADGRTVRYRVASSHAVSEQHAPVAEILGPTAHPVLTIITCEGTFDLRTRNYDQRRVVRAVLDGSPTASP